MGYDVGAPDKQKIDWSEGIRTALLVLAFLIPIQTLLPFKTFRPIELIILVFALGTFLTHRKLLLPPSLLSASLIATTGVLLTSIVSDHPLLSLDSGILEVCIPIALIYLFLTYGNGREFYQRAITLFVAGVAVLSLAQIIALYPEAWEKSAFGIPLTGDDFLAIRKDVPLMVHSLTIGNSDNYASLWVITLPLAVSILIIARPAWPAIVALLIIIWAGHMIFSRSALLVIALSLGAMWIARFRYYRAFSPAILAVIAAIAFPHINSLDYYSHGIFAFQTESERLDAPPPVAAPAPPAPSPSDPILDDDQSGQERAAAIAIGIQLAREHWAFGFGYGVYHMADPIHTAPHSMLLLRIAEGGILGGLSFLIFALWAPVHWLRDFWAGISNPLRLGALTALCAFMVKAIVFGASFAISSNIVWGFGVALCISAAASLQEE